MRARKGSRLRTVSAVAVLTMAAGLALSGAGYAAGGNVPKAMRGGLAEEVRHQLVMLPYYSVFDNLQYEVSGDGTVVLSGEVVRPTLKSDAANVVRRIEGVEKVVDKIEVLPLSNFDDQIRIREYRAIFASDSLYRYVLRAVPPIHIIVKNGHVTLAGVVATEADRNVAGIIANTVPGVFSVANNLTVEKKVG